MTPGVPGTVDEFSVPTASAQPFGITPGPDGNVWFTESDANQYARITSAGTITEFPIPAPPVCCSAPHGIVAGSDGNLWAAEQSFAAKMTTGGTVTHYPTSPPYPSPYLMTMGPDGNVWFTEVLNKVGFITPAGAITEFTLPSGSSPYGITTGPDGNIWFVERGSCRVAKMTLGGVLTEFQLLTGCVLSGITKGPDGAVWFTEYNGIGRITPTGGYTDFTLPAGTFPSDIAVDAVGNLIFTGTAQIGMMTAAGGYSSVAVPSGNTPTSVTVGPDNTIWFTEVNGNKIGRVNPSSSPFGPTLQLEQAGGGNLAEITTCLRCVGFPINLDTGTMFESAQDLSIPGRGPAIDFTRTYDSGRASLAGRLGYGWTDSYDWLLAVDTSGGPTNGWVTIRQANGSQTVFTPNGSGGYTAPSRVLASLVHNGDGTWTYTIRKTKTYTFSSTGALTKISDLNGYHTDLTYDGSGRLSTITDPAGRAVTVGYDASNRIHTISDTLPQTVTYNYDASGNLSTVVDLDGRTWTMGYDGSHRMTSVQDPRLHSVLTNYDPGTGRVTWQKDQRGKQTSFAVGAATSGGYHTTLVTHPRGNQDLYFYLQGMCVETIRGYGTSDAATWTYTYDPTTLGLTQTTDPNGHANKATFDSAGNQLTATDGLNRTTTLTYNALNEPLTVQDPLMVTTTNTYDAAGNLLTTSTPLVGSSPPQTAVTTYTYGDVSHPGDVTKVTDPDSKDTLLGYDSYGDPNSVTDPTGRKTTYTYNAVGWKLTEVTPAGNATGGNPAQHTITYSNFTGFGQPKTVTDQLGHATTYGYDADQNLTDATDADSRLTHTDYNEDNQPTLVTRPGSVTQATAYDDNGNVSSQTDSVSHATTYGYDNQDRLTSSTDALSRITSYTYDGAGNRLTMVQPGTPSGTLSTTYGYDNADENTTITYSDGVTHGVVYTYDADGQRHTMVDGSGTTTYTIDSLHRQTQVTNGAGKTVSYGYDIGSRQTTLTYPGSKVLTRTFDDAGRLKTTTDWLATPTTNTFGYDDDGNWTTTTYGNADTATRTFNRADQLTALTYKKGATTLGTLTYTRSNAGLLATTTPSGGAPGTTDNYTYNPRAQLTSRDNSGTTWAYDNADRTTKTLNGSTSVTLAYDNADQLTTATPATGPTTTYTYDNRGERTTSLVTGAGSSTTYAYDQAGNLKSYTPVGGTASTYTYDGDGLRATKTPAGGSSTPMTWDFTSGPAPLLLYDGTSILIYGPDGTPVEQLKGASNSYPMSDQLGSTIILTGSAGSISGTWTYDAYGTNTVKTGSGTIPILYAGQYLDSESGLYYMRARYYDPGTVQFLTPDPLYWVTRDRYGYVAQSPLSGRDPAGLSPNENEFGGETYDAQKEPGSRRPPLPDPLVAYAAEALAKCEAAEARFLGEEARDLSRPSNWGNAKTLERHFRDHGADFGSRSAQEYAQQASEFFQRSIRDQLPIKIDSEGVIRVYDPGTNTFGAYNPDGTTRTFFKPTSPTYFQRQPGSVPWRP